MSMTLHWHNLNFVVCCISWLSSAIVLHVPISNRFLHTNSICNSIRFVTHYFGCGECVCLCFDVRRSIATVIPQKPSNLVSFLCRLLYRCRLLETKEVTHVESGWPISMHSHNSLNWIQCSYSHRLICNRNILNKSIYAAALQIYFDSMVFHFNGKKIEEEIFRTFDAKKRNPRKQVSIIWIANECIAMFNSNSNNNNKKIDANNRSFHEMCLLHSMAIKCLVENR